MEDPQEAGRDIGSGTYSMRGAHDPCCCCSLHCFALLRNAASCEGRSCWLLPSVCLGSLSPAPCPPAPCSLPPRSAEIKAAFAEAAELLAEVCEDLDANEMAAAAAPVAAQGQQGGAQGGGPQGRSLLTGVLNVEAAVGRSAAALKSRQALESRAAAKSRQVLHERVKRGVRVAPQGGGVRVKWNQQRAAGKNAKKAAQEAYSEAWAMTRSKKAAEEAAREAYTVAGGNGLLPESLGGPQSVQLTGVDSGGGGKKGKRLGSRRTAAVEAAWGNKKGQFAE